MLLNQIRGVQPAADELADAQRTSGLDVRCGFYLQFESAPEFDLAAESLAHVSRGIELLSVFTRGTRTFATVFVPEGQLNHFENLVLTYLDRNTPTGQPKNKKLVDSVSQIRLAALDALWTDSPELFPRDRLIPVWWEVWLRLDDEIDTVTTFRAHAARIGIEVPARQLVFPERVVVAARATTAQLTQSVLLLNCVSELRRLKETTAFFAGLSPVDQRLWALEAVQRIRWAPEDAPVVCVLDTGVNGEHPLLSPGTTPNDMHTVQPDWGVGDDNGHGTNMAGLALLGDLTDVLTTQNPVNVIHRLESVKILRRHGDNAGALYGDVTREAIARAEVTAPFRKRIICMAVSAEGRERGKPSTWSAAVDSLASGQNDDTKRLFVLSAGNVSRGNWDAYPDRNSVEGIEDPGQAWNALTGGLHRQRLY